MIVFLSNSELCSVTLLKSNPLQVLPKSFESSRINHNRYGGFRFHYSYRWYIEQLELLKANSTKYAFWDFPETFKTAIYQYPLKNIWSDLGCDL